ncbi:hypothetical protein BJ742DRAFT_782640 [Cladochytrium replicatum]|nr:hypothetical protein BJ742DRAFT_782640 [Cladochytrium replicatum]
MNLRYQFKQKLEAERTKYAKLEDEHKMVAAILRDMQIELNRKNINVESQRLRMNGIAFWQKKHRDVENEKHDLQRLYDTLNVKLEKQARENERLKLEILHMTDQLSHLHGLSTIPEELECNRPTTMRSSQENLLGSTESDRELKVHQAVRRHRQVGTKSVVSGKSTMVGGNDVTKDKRLSVPLTGRPSVTTEDINKGTPWSRRPTGIDPKVWNSKSNQRDRVGSVAKKQQNGTIQEARRAGNSRIQSRDTELRQSEKLPSIVLQEVTPEEFVVRVEPRE